MVTKRLRYLLIVLLMLGCDPGVTVHDQIRASELVVDFLSSLQSPEGLRLAYEWTDDGFKEKMTFDEFVDWMSSVRERNARADVRLVAFEVFGPVDRINVYASSVGRLEKLYFRFTLVGNKVLDYYLLELRVDDNEQRGNGIYRKYEQPVTVPKV